MKKPSKSPKKKLSQPESTALPLSKETAKGQPSEKNNGKSTPQDDMAFLRAEEERLKESAAGNEVDAAAGRESKRFAEVIRKMRRLQELSQEELAERAGLHRNFVGAIERGQMSISLDNAERLANALGVKLKDLL